jgi:mycofactocin system glycosyltransferase
VPPIPLPEDFTLAFPPDLVRPRPEVLIGGSPLRVLRLTAAGAARVDRWMGGSPVGRGRGAGVLAARLVENGMAAPSPAGSGSFRVAIVVPVRDDPAGLEATLAALSATAPGTPVQVVDDGSDPPVGQVAGRAEVLRRPRPGGPAAARNAGEARLEPQPDVVVFVDAGCVPSPGWLEELLPHFADPGLAAIAPRVRSRAIPGTSAGLACYEAARSPLDLGSQGAPVRPGGPVPYVPTAALAVRSRAFREICGFDQSLRFGEDVDLVWRLHDAGWRVRYHPAAVVTHPARVGLLAWVRQRYDYGRSAAPLAARHGRAVAPLAGSPWSLAAWAFAAVGRPLPGVVIAAGTAEVLARRAAGDRAVAAELRRLALGGTARAGGPIASAVRRAWLPPALVGLAVVRAGCGQRTRRSVWTSALAVLAGPGLADWSRRRPEMGPAAWAAWCLADDLAYQAGVWAGVVRTRSPAALWPNW